MYFWDQKNRNRLSTFEKFKAEKCPVSAIAFAPNAKLFFYAIGYDWSRGADFYDQNKANPAFQPRIYCHHNTEAEINEK